MEWLTSLDWFALSCWFGAIVLIVLGFAGTIVPAIPGLPMIAAGGWLIGLITMKKWGSGPLPS